ncbi:hypothetical protein Q5P01_000657 [Channa striata]|uniref:Uncharacterized protein n=1 Tax=Channa striata TaxID=64152 RepID=A0AA88LF09_CHASR|nr:hypothetical protein Q5P01_000657 [Channa striata]
MTRATLRTTRAPRCPSAPEQAAGRRVRGGKRRGAGARLDAAQDKGGGGAPAGRARATGRRGAAAAGPARGGRDGRDGAPPERPRRRSGQGAFRREKGEGASPTPSAPVGFDKACPEAGASTGSPGWQRRVAAGRLCIGAPAEAGPRLAVRPPDEGRAARAAGEGLRNNACLPEARGVLRAASPPRGAGVASTGPRLRGRTAGADGRLGLATDRSPGRNAEGFAGPSARALPAMEADPQAGGTAHPNTGARPAGGGPPMAGLGLGCQSVRGRVRCATGKRAKRTTGGSGHLRKRPVRGTPRAGEADWGRPASP